MSERADRNVIDAGRGNPPHVLQVNSAAGLEFHLPFSGGNGLAHFARLHVIEQNDVDAFDFQKGTDLIEPIGFYFDFYPGPFLPQSFDGVDESGKAAAGAEMIVFHQDHIAEGGAMVRAAAGNNRGLFQRAQPRRRLAGIEDLGAGFPDRLHKLVRQGGNAAKALEEIERDAFRGQDRSGGTADFQDRLATGQRRPVRLQDLYV